MNFLSHQQGGTNTTSVLLVEDNEGDYVIIRSLVRDIPDRLDLHWVSTFEAGLAHMVNNEYDIYLLDYRLGNQDGLELLKTALAKGCNRPIIFLTGHGNYALDLQAMRDGAVDFLVKNELSAAALERSIRYSVANWRARMLLESSLHEKEILLKEIHHRVKNNLQMISSMLRLQARRVENESIRKAFEENCDRIRSIALIHDQLYRSDHLEAIDFAEYVRKLVSDLVDSIIGSSNRVSVEYKMTEVSLPVTNAVPYALLVHELASNALKHGFPGDRHGKIEISLARQNGELSFMMRDDGVGVPPNTDSGSLGLELARVFASLLGGTLECTYASGAHYKFRTPLTMEARTS